MFNIWSPPSSFDWMLKGIKGRLFLHKIVISIKHWHWHKIKCYFLQNRRKKTCQNNSSASESKNPTKHCSFKTYLLVMKRVLCHGECLSWVKSDFVSKTVETAFGVFSRPSILKTSKAAPSGGGLWWRNAARLLWLFKAPAHEDASSYLVF